MDVVLTDWIMPGLHGLDVVEVLHQYRPSLPVVVISAYTRTIHPIIRRGSRIRILEKPFTIEQVQSAVAEMIARAARLENERLQKQSAGVRSQVDLVKAAWRLHHARQQHRDEVLRGPDDEERLEGEG